MQRRELFYRSPADPFGLIESRLASDVGDQQLGLDLQFLKKLLMNGDEPSPQLAAALCKDAERSTIPGAILLEAARGFQWLLGENVACAFFHAGLAKAWKALRAEPSTESLDLLRALDQTAALWQASDPEALVLRFRIARRLTPALSVESRRAGYHLAESLLNVEHLDEAADLILQVQSEHQRVGDLGKRDPSDIPEMRFITGLILFDADRYRDAIPYLAATQGDQAERARIMLFESYIRTKQLPAASNLIASEPDLERPLPRKPRSLASRFEEEATRERWRQEVGGLAGAPQ